MDEFWQACRSSGQSRASLRERERLAIPGSSRFNEHLGAAIQDQVLVAFYGDRADASRASDDGAENRALSAAGYSSKYRARCCANSPANLRVFRPAARF